MSKHIEIAQINVGAPFRYLWLKYVTGINLDAHCAQGLLGAYSKQIDKRQGIQKGLVLDEYPNPPAFYLCGVAQPFDWNKNFHLAFRHAPGRAVQYESNGISIHLEDAERFLFEDYDVRSNSGSQHRDKKAYYTCRNFIFANFAKAYRII